MMIDYDEKITNLTFKDGSGWKCTQCKYTAQKRGHIKKHVQKHIEGYSFNCNTCAKTFTRKYTLKSMQEHAKVQLPKMISHWIQTYRMLYHCEQDIQPKYRFFFISYMVLS